MSQPKFDEPLVILIERDLMNHYGPMLSNDDLRQALGYPSKDAFKQSQVRGTVPIPVFDIEGRRGKFALVKDVAVWLVEQRARADPSVKLELPDDAAADVTLSTQERRSP